VAAVALVVAMILLATAVLVVVQAHTIHLASEDLGQQAKVMTVVQVRKI